LTLALSLMIAAPQSFSLKAAARSEALPLAHHLTEFVMKSLATLRLESARLPLALTATITAIPTLATPLSRLV